MASYSYAPKGVCSTRMEFEIDDENKIHNLKVTGGCNGNLKAIGRLVEGQDAKYIADLLEGNLCGPRGTSCADQFSKALKKALG